jgi:hypothetical protein
MGAAQLIAYPASSPPPTPSSCSSRSPLAVLDICPFPTLVVFDLASGDRKQLAQANGCFHPERPDANTSGGVSFVASQPRVPEHARLPTRYCAWDRGCPYGPLGVANIKGLHCEVVGRALRSLRALRHVLGTWHMPSWNMALRQLRACVTLSAVAEDSDAPWRSLHWTVLAAQVGLPQWEREGGPRVNWVGEVECGRRRRAMSENQPVGRALQLCWS